LSKVEIRACFVPHIHGLAELALGVVTVEDNAVQGDNEGLYDNFDDTADQGPGLE
jgi:hypothetical protein